MYSIHTKTWALASVQGFGLGFTAELGLSDELQA